MQPWLAVRHYWCMNTAWQVREMAAERDGSAFDAWVRRELRERYADVLREPVPDELVALLSA